MFIEPFLGSAEEVCVRIGERNINKIHVLKGFPIPQQEREQSWKGNTFIVETKENISHKYLRVQIDIFSSELTAVLQQNKGPCEDT